MPKQQSSSNASAQAPLDNRPRRPSAEPARKPLVLLAPCLEASPHRLRATVLSHETLARDISGTSELILPEIWRRMIAQENGAVEKSRHRDFFESKNAAVAALRRLFFCRFLHTLQHFLQVAPRKKPAVHNHTGNLLAVADIGERIAIQKHKVRDFSILDCAQLVFQLKKARRVNCCGLQGFERGETRRDKALQLLVQAEARENVDAGRRIGAS